VKQHPPSSKVAAHNAISAEIGLYDVAFACFHGSDERTGVDDLLGLRRLPQGGEPVDKPRDGVRRMIEDTGRKPRFLQLAVAIAKRADPAHVDVKRAENGVDAMTQRPSPFTVAPDGLAALIGVEKYLQTCGLDHKLAALVKTRVSQINGCAYCLHMHTEEAQKLGESGMRLHLLDAWHESHLYSARERATLAWAETLTNIAATHAPDNVYDEASRQFSEKELADLSIAIAMINAWNRLAIGSRSVHPADIAKAA
jgi:AhpD family alkylhydroperoxidase